MAYLVPASTLKSHAKVGIAVLTMGRHDFSPFLKSMQKEFSKQGVLAEIIIASGRDLGPQFSQKLISTVDRVIIPGEHGTVLDRIIASFEYSCRHHDAMLFIPDDFDHMAAILPSFTAPALNGKPAVLAKWDAKYKLYMPYAMYLCEMGASCAVSYLLKQNPKEKPPAADCLDEFAKEARLRGAFYETYTGFMVFGSNGWKEAKQSLDSIFLAPSGKHDSLPNFAIEPGLLLAVLHNGIQHEVIETPRRYEHGLLKPGSEEEKKFSEGRAGVFIDALAACSAYANKHAPEKKSGLIIFANNLIKKIVKAGFNYPDHEVQPTEWNSTIKAVFS